jgi:hypothetical protein
MIYLLVWLNLLSRVKITMVGLGSSLQNSRHGDIVSNECLEKSVEPAPVRSLVVCYFTRFTTDISKQQKFCKKSRRNCKFLESSQPEQIPALICRENKLQVQPIMVFSERKSDMQGASSSTTRRILARIVEL